MLFNCSLLNDTVSNSEYAARIMNWKGHENKLSWPNSRYYPSIFCPEEFRNTMKILSKLDLNLGLQEYKEMITT